jgi:prepilin-type N-terminal cleavage/methylation domain-containing protein/prepilin-type processing-associated H-X9-DG protein
MKRKAFTLVELMVVIAIIALLVAILLPSMSSVISVTRAAICMNNLSKLGAAFALGSGTRAVSGGGGVGTGTGALVFPYPDSMLWPGVPKEAVADPVIFVCPEDVGKEGKARTGNVQDMFALLEYRNALGSFKMNTVGGKAFLYISQTGTDTANGPFTEFLLQDDNNNGQFELMGFNSWWDTDGYVRVYHSGYIWVPSVIPPEEKALRYPNAGGPGYNEQQNRCPFGEMNAIFFRGKPAFGTTGDVAESRGQKDRPGFKLKDWMPWLTNYGISSVVYQYSYGAKALLLVDYPEFIVDLEAPLTVDTKLAGGIGVGGARHLGKVNGLWADGSVTANMPLNISPRLRPETWAPKVPNKKPAVN